MAKNLTNILNKSAIANWSGYIYQGLCGLYHALKLINEGVNPSEYKLWLDAYEDFSIEKNNLMVSLHQCKCDTHSPNSYKGEFEKMLQKKEYYADRLSPDCKLWFHCNHKVKNLSTDYDPLWYSIVTDKPLIFTYTYHNGQNECDPIEIIQLIKEKVDEIIQKQHHYSDAKLITVSLISLIDIKVLKVHSEYLKSREKLINEAKNYAYISFQDIFDVVQQEIVNFNSDDIYIYWKIIFITKLKILIDSEPEIDTAKIYIVINAIESMTNKELQDFFQRINPDIKVSKGILSSPDFLSKDRAQTFVDIVNELDFLNDVTLCWNEKNKYETPTAITIKRNNKIKRLCLDIINNSANLNSIWIYDWMVGDGDFNKVENIYEQTNSIVSTPDQNNSSTSIFRHKKVGILTIKDMQDGNYN